MYVSQRRPQLSAFDSSNLLLSSFQTLFELSVILLLLLLSFFTIIILFFSLVIIKLLLSDINNICMMLLQLIKNDFFVYRPRAIDSRSLFFLEMIHDCFTITRNVLGYLRCFGILVFLVT